MATEEDFLSDALRAVCAIQTLPTKCRLRDDRLAKMAPPMQQSLGNVDELVRKVTVVDWDTINAHRAQWDTRWNRQIER